jgi:hypothetical protein
VQLIKADLQSAGGHVLEAGRRPRRFTTLHIGAGGPGSASVWEPQRAQAQTHSSICYVGSVPDWNSMAFRTFRLASSGVGDAMNGLIYLVGLVVVIMAILSFFGLH